MLMLSELFLAWIAGCVTAITIMLGLVLRDKLEAAVRDVLKGESDDDR